MVCRTPSRHAPVSEFTDRGVSILSGIILHLHVPHHRAMHLHRSADSAPMLGHERLQLGSAHPRKPPETFAQGLDCLIPTDIEAAYQAGMRPVLYTWERSSLSPCPGGARGAQLLLKTDLALSRGRWEELGRRSNVS